MTHTTCPTMSINEEIEFARRRAKDSFRMMRLRLTEATSHLDCLEERFDAETDLEAQAERTNLAMKYMACDLLPKMRLDSAADAQAALLVAAARRVTA